MLDDGSIEESTEYGTATVDVRANGEMLRLNVNDVVYVSDMADNLFSVKAAGHNGCVVTLT